MGLFLKLSSQKISRRIGCMAGGKCVLLLQSYSAKPLISLKHLISSKPSSFAEV